MPEIVLQNMNQITLNSSDDVMQNDRFEFRFAAQNGGKSIIFLTFERRGPFLRH